MSIIERALAKAKQQDRAAVEDAEGLVHRAQVAPGADVVPRGRPVAPRRTDRRVPRTAR